ncbi:hypothetical protein BH09BAC3_BH09BAC3_25520 [soil metagenome]
MNYKLLCAVVFGLIAFSALGQDEALTQRLNGDLLKRFPETSEVTVEWRQMPYGNMAFYTVNNQPKMSLYKGDGKFSKSYTQESWQTRVPENVKMEFDNSPYYSFSVITFWESDASDYKTYFLEMQDKEGVSKEAWFDENGKFSATPFR